MEYSDSMLFDNPSECLVSEVLTGDENYFLWKKKMESVLGMRNMLGFVNGKEVKPSDDPDRLSKWDQRNALGEMSLAAYYVRWVRLWDELDCLDEIDSIKLVPGEESSCWEIWKKRRESDKVMQFLTGLAYNVYYSVLISDILLMDPLPSVDFVFSKALNLEVRINIGKPVAADASGVNSARYDAETGERNGKRKNRSRKNHVCGYCGINGHLKDNCYKLIVSTSQMRWLSSSSIPSWKKQQRRLPSILSISSGGDHFKISSCLSSSSTVARATASDYRKSNYVDSYIENIKSHKRKICRGLLPIDLSWLMGSYSKIGRTEYGFGVIGLILKLGYTPHVIGINILMNALCQQLRINEAALLFQKMETHLSCKPNIVTYGTLLKGLCTTGNSRIALNLHEQIADGTHDLSRALQLNLICYNTLIDGLCKDGLIDKANELFLEMRKKEIRPDVITYTIVIDGLCRAGKWEEAKALFHEMLDHGLERSVFTFNVLINALAKMGKSKEAKELLLLMIQSGQMPDVVTYNSLMDSFYREGNIEELKEVFVFMDRKGITANVVTYNILIKGYCKLGMIDIANAEYRRMIQNRVKPTIITINALLEGMLLKGMVSEAIELKREITVHNLTPDMCTYTILIDGLGKNGYIQEAVKLFDKMRDIKLRPDVVTYSSLIDGLCKAGKLEKALLLFDGMSCDGVVPNITTYTILIYGLCKAEKIVEAEKLFDMMSDSNLKPNVITYSSLIDGLCKAGKLEKALLLFERMSSDSVVPDCRTYSILINGLCKAEKIVEAENLFDMMSDSKLKPDVVTYNSLIDGLCKAGKLEKAILLFDGMSSDGVVPNVTTYTILIDGLCKVEKIVEAEKLFDMVSDSKLKPDVVTYSSLIDGLCKAGKLEKALLLFDGMSSDGVVPNVTTYTILIDGLCKAEKIIEAEKLFVDMEKNGILPNVCTFGALIHGFCRMGDTNKVIELLQMMADRQIKLNDAIDYMVISRLLKEEKYDEYLNLLPTFPQRGAPTSAKWSKPQQAARVNNGPQPRVAVRVNNAVTTPSNHHITGSKKRKSVPGLEEATVHENLGLPSFPASNHKITEINKPLSYAPPESNTVHDVVVTFLAMRSDGKEVLVDNKFMKAYYPQQLINFYEKNLRYNPVS
ncbi:unnamed protein product [Rhodiola kirilowii]